MGRFGVYALYLVFNYYNNSDINGNTTHSIKNNTVEDNCNGELQDQTYKGIDCSEDVSFLECCQYNVDKIVNTSVEMNSCLNYSNYGNYSNMYVDCHTNENLFYEYLIVIGFSVILTIIMSYIFYRMYKRCFINGYSYHYLNINENIDGRY